VLDLKIGSKIALEAYVKMPKLMGTTNRSKEMKRDVLTKNTWIADSGASTHIGNSDEGMTDVKVIDSPIQIGNGTTLCATKIGRKTPDSHIKRWIKAECGNARLYIHS
jgi:hypothetical protein